MIDDELKKRIFTSIILILLLIFMFYYSYILIISLIIVSIIVWIEFYGLISKIFKKKNFKNKLLLFLVKSFSLIYLSLFSFLIVVAKFKNTSSELFVIYSLLVSINSDLGGLIIGKTFKGRKLTLISPNKTLSGSLGSFLFSLLLIPFFYQYFNNFEIITFIFITLLISLVSQIGDLFISYLKRKAKVKDTGDLLPGHGGFLDRLDGILFAVPFGLILFNLL